MAAKSRQRGRRARTYADTPQGRGYAAKKVRAKPIEIVITATNRHDMQDQINRQLEAGYRAPDEVADDVINAVFSLDFGANPNMATSFADFAEDIRKQMLLKIFESIVDSLHDYIVYLIENQDSLLPEFSSYPRLSDKTMKYDAHPHDKYFFNWSGDLINNGLSVIAEEGKTDKDFPEIRLEIVEGIHKSPVGGGLLDYRTLFKFLEYGTRNMPPRPFFGVIEYKVEEFIRKAVNRIQEGKDVDTTNFSWI